MHATANLALFDTLTKPIFMYQLRRVTLFILTLVPGVAIINSGEFTLLLPGCCFSCIKPGHDELAKILDSNL